MIEGAVKPSCPGISLSVEYHPFETIEGSLVKLDAPNAWKILISSKISNKRRQRFTLAHELGHFLCHRQLQNKFEDSVDTLNDFNNQLEAEANLFASWLLMPANLIKEEFEDRTWTIDSLQDLSLRFEASLQAGALRILNLTKKPRAFVVSRDSIIRWAKKSEAAPFMSSYVFGDELPAESDAARSNTNTPLEPTPNYAWNSNWLANESQYFDSSGTGYQYTCIEFIRNDYCTSG